LVARENEHNAAILRLPEETRAALALRGACIHEGRRLTRSSDIIWSRRCRPSFCLFEQGFNNGRSAMLGFIFRIQSTAQFIEGKIGYLMLDETENKAGSKQSRA
jgi:hypothetical protein